MQYVFSNILHIFGFSMSTSIYICTKSQKIKSARNLHFLHLILPKILLTRYFTRVWCWNHQPLAMFNLFADCNKFFCNISRYSSPIMFPSINTKLPMPDDEKHPQHLTFPPPCFTVGTVHLGSSSSLVDRQTMTFPSDPNKLNLLSSDQITLFQKPRGFSRYVRAYSSRFQRFVLLRYGFFRATRPYKPIS